MKQLPDGNHQARQAGGAEGVAGAEGLLAPIQPPAGGTSHASSAFCDDIHGAAREAAVRVRLIDGDEVAELMIDFSVGVANKETIIAKKIDSDFFDDLAI